MKRIKGWNYAHTGGRYRSFKKEYALSKYGLIKPQVLQIEDPLYLMFPYKEIFDAVRYREVETWAKTNDNSLISNASNSFMIEMGNTLVRLVKKPKN